MTQLTTSPYTVKRLLDRPIITPDMHPGDLKNINGPSLIRVPDWLPNPLGKYYMYFAHHQGKYIRLAYADDLAGPWTLYEPGTLKLEQTPYEGHIASPDVHIDHDKKRLVMYYHGPFHEGDNFAGQRSSVAVSDDGITFDTSNQTILGPFYFRVFEHEGWHYAIAKSITGSGNGVFLRSKDGHSEFEYNRDFLPRMRHAAVLKRDNYVDIFYSRGEDCPEHIMVSRMKLDGDWTTWDPSEGVSILMPERDYEGAHEPLEASSFGAIHHPVHQLRDPDIFEDSDGELYLTYSCAGETSLAMVELVANTTNTTAT